MKLLRRLLLAFAILFALPHFVSAQTPNGATLYASNCQGCHGPLATSNVSNRTLAGIKAAIAGNVGGMGFLASLTDADLQAIANALSPPAPAPALSVSPTSLNFTYAQGGTAPASQSISVTSSGAPLTFMAAASGGTWLSVNPTSGTTGNPVSVSVNPAGMPAGTYNGTVTITALAGSPQTVAVTLAISAATPAPGLSASPKTLSFSYQSGGGMPAAQPIMISSSGAALSYMVAASGTWLSATPTSGSTPGTVNVSVSPASMAAGTYKGTVTITPSGAAGSPQTITVTLVVSAGGGTGSSSMKITPSTLHFSYQTGDQMPSAKKLTITSTSAPLSYTASYSGGSWITVSPTGGTTPGTIRVSVNPAGMSAGSYSGAIDVSAPGAKTFSVTVTLDVTSSNDDNDDGGQGSDLHAEPYVYDPTHSGAVAAQWVDGVGVPLHNGKNAGYQGLLLSKNASASADAQAGAVIKNAQGLTLTELGFDVRDGGQCSAGSPHFVVVTSDNVTHVVGGCGKGTTQTSLAMIGWKRMQFDPSKPEQASPPITPGQQVKSIAVMLDQGPEAGASAAGGIVVLDNISINGKVAGKK